MIIVLYTLISRGMWGNGGENPPESAAIRSVERKRYWTQPVRHWTQPDENKKPKKSECVSHI